MSFFDPLLASAVPVPRLLSWAGWQPLSIFANLVCHKALLVALLLTNIEQISQKLRLPTLLHLAAWRLRRLVALF